MEPETLKALIPAIPGMITAGIAVCKDVLFPLFKKIGYNITKEKEREMLALEEKKDIETFIEKLEGINKEINQTIIMQSQTGDKNTQINYANSKIDTLTQNFYNTEEKQNDVKKN